MDDVTTLGGAILGLSSLAVGGLAATGRMVPPLLIFACIAGIALLVMGANKKPEPKPERTKKRKEKKKFVPKAEPTPVRQAPEPVVEKLSKNQKRRLAERRKADEAAAEAAKRAAVAAEEKAAEKKKKKKKPKKAIEAPAPVVEEKPDEPTKKKKKKKKAKKVLPDEEEVVAFEETVQEELASAEDGWEVAQTKTEARRAAKKNMVKVVNDPEGPEPVSKYMEISQKYYGAIIGPSGQTLRDIETATASKIELPKKDSGLSTVTITGQPDGITLTVQALNEIVEKGYTTVTNPEMTDASLVIPSNKIGVVVGSGGSTLKLIQEKTGTNIKIPKKDSKVKETTILGDSAGVLAATTAIQSLISDGYSQLTHPGHTKMSISFPAKLLGVLIGPGGETIKGLQQRTSTKINVPETRGQGDEVVTIVGLSTDVQRAAMEIRQMQADFTREELEIPAIVLGAVVGEKGQNIRALQNRTGCRIDIGEHDWDPSMRCLTLEGIRSAVDSARMEIQTLVDNTTRRVLDFPADRIGNLIGSKGETLKTIMANAPGVRINITEHEWDLSVKEVLVDGPVNSVLKAVELIEKILADINRPREPREPRETKVKETKEPVEPTAN